MSNGYRGSSFGEFVPFLLMMAFPISLFGLLVWWLS